MQPPLRLHPYLDGNIHKIYGCDGLLSYQGINGCLCSWEYPFWFQIQDSEFFGGKL